MTCVELLRQKYCHYLKYNWFVSFVSLSCTNQRLSIIEVALSNNNELLLKSVIALPDSIIYFSSSHSTMLVDMIQVEQERSKVKKPHYLLF